MNLIGFEREKEIFKKLVDKSRFANAYIFTGIEGSGKLIFAKMLAKSVLCPKGSFFSDCECHDCKLIENNSHPDLYVLDIDTIDNTNKKSKEEDSQAKNSIGIEDIKSLREDAFLTPYRGKYKFFLINDAHKMTEQASNALLKTLEEPPSNTIFILITHLIEKLLPTIKSRSLIFEFSRLNNDDVLKILSSIMPESDKDKITEAAMYCSGSVKTAIEYMEFYGRKHINIDVSSEIKTIIEFLYRLKDKEDLRYFLTQLYWKFLEGYRQSKRNDYLTFSNYLLNVLSMLNYNLNLNVAKTDLIIKLYGEFCE